MSTAAVRVRDTASASPAPKHTPQRLAGWADQLGAPGPETPHSRRMAHLGGVVAISALVGYLTWRIAFTLPGSGINATAAWVLVSFEALPLIGTLVRMATIWNIDSAAPASGPPAGLRVAVLIPTYDEPAEVIAPTIAAACALEPAHQTWVLDDGDRDWVEDLCRSYGARYVRRAVHDHAKAGNLNNALALMQAESTAGAPEIDVVAVLDCDHVPLTTFLTATLGWFADPKIGLVQGPQAFYNAGAFDDDGVNGEQGLFFNVLMASRNHRDGGPFWCGSTALVRTRALREIGGVSTETIVEDMHTTLGLIRAGWRTAYHHQTLAVGIAPMTSEQYLLQRRRWGMGAMQVLTTERLWAAKRWLSWRNYYEYLGGTLWWLEGMATVGVLMVPVTLLLLGAQTSTAPPATFTAVFAAAFFARLWGIKRLYRHQLSWSNALALRILRIPVGLSCAWWMLTRRTLEFQVTPKQGAQERVLGRIPRIIHVLLAGLIAVLGYAIAGLAGLVPWRASASSTVASGAWLLIATTVIALGMRRIRSDEFASSRRNAHRFDVGTTVDVDGAAAELVDISVGGISVRLPHGTELGSEPVPVTLPGLSPIRLTPLPRADGAPVDSPVALRVAQHDWDGHRALSQWLFHTPADAVPLLPPGVPAAAATEPATRRWVVRNRAAAARVRVAHAAPQGVLS